MIFNSILIANRGEIACRIIQTAHEMGVRCVAVYVDDDRESPYVKMADQSVRLPDGGYLDGKEIIKAAKESGAEAIHPGYGFLSENASFARKVIKEGLIWIGPSANAISVMGDKLKAKELAEKAEVPTLPMASSSKDANKIGYPLLIKAAAGGGGKGMRIVYKPKDLNEAIKSAQREAKSGFGDERIFIERYVEKSRHIEIQIIGDKTGKACHLSERDCSIQRRHQKLAEETPSPFMTDKLREEMGTAAIKAAEAVKYEGVGTVEFLVDKHRKFYFMEMNTRIQVEHPVTEEVVDFDLIKEQIKVAAGIKISGRNYLPQLHAIECRINAEDPENDFRPSPGMITNFHAPGGHGIRIDTHVYANYMIPPFYDSMIAKLITVAQTRDEAILKMSRALDEFVIEGIKTTIPFHQKLMKDKNFQKGKYTTKFMDEFKI